MKLKDYIPLFTLLALIAVTLVVGLIGKRYFSSKPTPSKNVAQKVEVATSFYPLYFFSSQIGGDKVDVTNITPSGAEPHDYEPTTGDVVKITNSNLLVLNGAVEAWGDKIRENLAGKNVKIVVAGEGLLTQQLAENGVTATDPHVWLSPQLAKKEVDKISQALIQVDPKDQNYFQTNTSNLEQELDQIDQSYQRGLVNCQQKDIITSHAAFGYLATAYGLNQVPIAGLSPDEEPSPKQLADVANFARAHNVKYIFFESLVSPKLSDTIASEIGAKTLVLDPLEGISDADMNQGKNYFTVMQDNLINLQTTLQCER